MEKQEPILKLISLLNINCNSIDELIDKSIEQDILRGSNIIEKYYEMIPELKKHYNSEMLNCLHKNSLKKQKFPAVNMLRQVLKCNNYKLRPFVVSNGYDKSSGKKITQRFYVIEKLKS
jgi:hypothetical protein